MKFQEDNYEIEIWTEIGDWHTITIPFYGIGKDGEDVEAEIETLKITNHVVAQEILPTIEGTVTVTER